MTALLIYWICRQAKDCPNPERERGIGRPSLTLRVAISATIANASGPPLTDLECVGFYFSYASHF